jgi:tellurite resistance protein
MLTRKSLDPQEALACTMVLVAAADGAITDREIGVMAALVQSLPVFQNFTSDHLDQASDTAVKLLEENNGLAHGARLIREALSGRLRETAYALAAEIIASDLSDSEPSLRMLEFIGAELEIDPLVAAALERGARARQHRPT